MSSSRELLTSLGQGAVAACCLHACLMVLWLRVKERSAPAIAWLWLGWCCALGVLFLLRESVAFSWAGTVAAAMLVPGAVLAQLATFSRAGGREENAARRLMRTMWIALLVALAISALEYLIWVVPAAGGVDFFFFVLWARDRVMGDAQGLAAQYAYSPGAYAFWGWVWRLAGNNLRVFQAVIVAVMTLAAAGAGAVVWRVTRARAGAITTFFVALAAFSRLEGATGTSEPLILLVVMAGLAVWGGGGLQARVLPQVPLALGLALGIAVKQQGVLLLGGWAGVAAVDLWRGAPLGRVLRVAASFCLLTVVLVLGFFLMEGEGLTPVLGAAQMTAEYESRGPFVRLVRDAWRGGFWLVLVAAVAGAVLLARSSSQDHPAVQVVAFSLAGAGATVLQFTKRGYLHYALLTAGLLAVAAGIAVALLWERWQGWGVRKSLAGWVAASLLIAAVAVTNADGSGAWVPLRPSLSRQAPVCLGIDRQRQIDLAALAGEITPGSSLLVLPTQSNYVHFFLGTVPRTRPLRYAFPPEVGEFAALTASPATTQLMVCPELSAPENDPYCGVGGCQALLARLADLGYLKAARAGGFGLYRRPAGPRHAQASPSH